MIMGKCNHNMLRECGATNPAKARGKTSRVCTEGLSHSDEGSARQLTPPAGEGQGAYRAHPAPDAEPQPHPGKASETQTEGYVTRKLINTLHRKSRGYESQGQTVEQLQS